MRETQGGKLPQLKIRRCLDCSNEYSNIRVVKLLIFLTNVCV